MNAREWDWRFLLPAIPAGSSIHVAGVSTAELDSVASLTGCRVAATPAEAGVAVVVDGDLAAADSLRERYPAARIVLMTIDRRRARNLAAFPARLRRSLKSQGFAPAAAYWAKPRLPSPSGWIPLGSRPVLHWYLETRLRRRNLALRWAAGVGLRSIRVATAVLDLVVPAYAVVAKCTADRQDTSVGAAPVPAAARLGGDEAIKAVAIVAGGEGPWSRVTFLPFGPRTAMPIRCVKVPRLAAYNSSARREQEVLHRLQATNSPALVAAVPRALGTVEHHGLVVALESYKAGAGLHLLFNQWPHESQRSLRGLQLAADWLVALARATARPLTTDAIREIVLEPIEEYLSGPADAAENELLAEVAAEVTGWGSGALAEVLIHRDFGPWNVLIEGGQVSVIDWENAGRGLPLSDLVYLLLHSIWHARGARDVGRESRDVVALLDSPAIGDPLPAAAQRLVGHYLGEVGLDRRILRPVLAVTLVQQALDQRHRLAELESSDVPAVDDRYATYLRALAQVGR